MSLSVHITKKIGNFRLAVDMEQESGVTGILGASGCGKSMTLKCIAGIEKPDTGRIVLNERVLFDSEKGINIKPQERNVGYLFQNYALFPNMTVEQNIFCGLSKEKDKTVCRNKLERMLEVMGIQAYRKQYPHQLSGGQQQRTALARILVSEPELLLLDEPFSALDAYLREQLQTQVRHILKKFGKDVLMVSHNRDEVYYLCEQTAVMHQGQIVEQAKTEKLFLKPQTKEAVLLIGKTDILDMWMQEAKASEHAGKIGMYLTHNGIVRETAKAKVREGEQDAPNVTGMLFSYDAQKVEQAVADTYQMEGIYFVRAWLNEGVLQVGDDIMYVLIGGDIRPHVTEALDFLVSKLKGECVEEKELYETDENRRSGRADFVP